LESIDQNWNRKFKKKEATVLVPNRGVSGTTSTLDEEKNEKKISQNGNGRHDEELNTIAYH